jgi:hypothetical protein
MKRRLVVALFVVLALAGTLAVIRNRGTLFGAALNPRIVSLTATPQVVGRGESVKLDWETEGVGTVVLEWGAELRPNDNKQRLENLPPTGTMTFQPQEDTIYVLECESATAQICTSSATVRVR